MPKPVVKPVWMGRDLDENGTLRGWVTVWTTAPTRYAGGNLGKATQWWVPDGYSESVWIVDALRRYGVVPDDDRQLIRFDCGERKR